MSALILTINLKGHISGSQKHIDKQIISIDISPVGAKNPEVITRKIKHNDRVETKCYRKLKISAESVQDFQNGECPYWEKPNFWKNMNKKQRLESHLKRYDEGFGFSYDFIENSNF